ncbi:MAG: hypothetical protein BWY89_01601 [Bacteroidetes bacterium ADurb.BinA012]|nr:MAG: hypothetical protein BWY89_01601 [Bacteroidetes bacterium ADurb.BinA012]
MAAAPAINRDDLRASVRIIIFLSAAIASFIHATESGSAISSGRRNDPARPGIRKNMKARPPVIMAAICTDLAAFSLFTPPSEISLRASTPSSGTSTPAMTRVIDTALNLLYPGKKSMKRVVSGMRFLPHERKRESSAAVNIHHFSRPLISIRPSTNRNSTTAPK